ncbi:16S rRNA (cytosine(1402)-N(4))-methyltransferase RsmH [Patescibacteria group bacterium]|nr:16S rRNA (cytosine(1402)-N(4))-methyltransferase RsmH [Patescibacteria group bacterium]
MIHIPVLLNEVIKYFDPKPNQNFIDGTLGNGGHALKILSLTKPQGKLLGLDLSKQVINELTERKAKDPKIKDRLILVCDNFIHLKKIVQKLHFQPIDGILLDLGLSSDLLENSGQGFSFMRDERLDMRYNSEFTDLTAEKIINQYSKEELTQIFKEFSQERFSRRIANQIVSNRKKQKIITTDQLRNIIQNALGRYFHIKSLARIFQSLRIEVNNELENLQQVLLSSIDLLSPGGRMIVISYHSLEDRIVKRFFKQESRLKILTKKPITPSHSEVVENRRSRSAKLRVAIKL